jgi:rod shape-determining protein MreC
VFEYSQLRHDNARLRAQIEALRAQQIQDQYLQQENKDLTDQLKLDFVGDIPKVASRVIGGAESNFQVTVIIDRGSGTGIAKGMPVVAGLGLVGRVIEVSARQSTVMLLTDASMGVGVQFAPSQAVGVAQGQGSGRPLDVTLVDPSLETKVGTVAVSSGLAGSPYPRGIPLGKVTSDIAQPGVHGHTVTVAPIVDLARLSYVDVLIWTPQTHPVTTPDAGAVPTTSIPQPGSTTVPP